jgi:uncharacterized protein
MPFVFLILLLLGGGAAAQDPFEGLSTPPPLYNQLQNSSLYVPMRDGVRLALEVLLPKDLPPNTKIPAILRITRYGRAPVNGSIPPADRFFAERGYARISVDERGTGASFGTVRYGKPTLGDMREIVDWVVKQPWSNGNVGAIGVSYEGTTSELLAATGHPAVKAVIPRFPDFDYYTDLLFPGGIFNEWFVRTWAGATKAMDQGGAAKPVDGDSNRALLKQAIAEHAANFDLYASLKAVTFADDVQPGLGLSLRDQSTYMLRAEIEKANVPMLVWSSWYDAATAAGAIHRYRTFRNPQRVYLGAWSHGATNDANPFFAPNTPVYPTREQELADSIRFFDIHLKQQPTPFRWEDRRIYYFTMGENRWKSTGKWPPGGLSTWTMYPRTGNTLVEFKPPTADTTIEGTLTGGHTTGSQNRWHTQMGGGDVIYAEREKHIEPLFGFSTAPLRQDVVITGQPVLKLRVALSKPDTKIFAYLDLVNEKGEARYITEGLLRTIHGKSKDDAPYDVIGAYYSFSKKDAVENPTKLEIAMLPTSVRVPKGWRVRISLAGGDRDTFGGEDSRIRLLPGSKIEIPVERGVR